MMELPEGGSGETVLRDAGSRHIRPCPSRCREEREPKGGEGATPAVLISLHMIMEVKIEETLGSKRGPQPCLLESLVSALKIMTWIGRFSRKPTEEKGGSSSCLCPPCQGEGGNNRSRGQTEEEFLFSILGAGGGAVQPLNLEQSNHRKGGYEDQRPRPIKALGGLRRLSAGGIGEDPGKTSRAYESPPAERSGEEVNSEGEITSQECQKKKENETNRMSPCHSLKKPRVKTSQK